MRKISALYVLKNGPYSNLKDVDPWDEDRDARLFKGPGPVIAHPPCQRWGRYWSGGPMLAGTKKAKLLGDDDGCFAHALWAVRTFGGVLEHPEASHAWSWFDIRKPHRQGGWIEADDYGGWTCCVAQGHYGHRAQKLSWLYCVDTDTPSLKWGLCPDKTRIDPGFHSKEEAQRIRKTGIVQRLSQRQRALTPTPFRDVLLAMVR